MTHRDSLDFTAGLALGALLGAGLAFALRRIRQGSERSGAWSGLLS